MAAQPLHINQLPDDLLLRILTEALSDSQNARWDIGEIESAPRRDAALVYRRWAALCNAAPVVASLTVYIGPTAAFLARVRAFCCWLVRHGAGKVQHLRLALQPHETWQPGQPQPPVLSAEAALELSKVLAAALPTCAGSLRQLELAVIDRNDCMFPMGVWVAMMGIHLRRLVLDIRHLHVAVSLEALPGLQDLELHNYATLELQCRLPPSLTRLRLVADGALEALPNQVTALTSLVDLECRHYDGYLESGYEALTALSGSLRRLTLDGCATAPNCLSCLTALESLSLLSTIGVGTNSDDCAPLRAALPHLSRLTHLEFLMEHPFPDADDQAAFACVPQLVSLRYCVLYPDAPPLSGAWLARLRSLAAPLSAVAASLPALSSTASQLAELEVQSDYLDDSAALLPAVAEWAVQHTSLRRLVLLHGSHQFDPALQARLLHVQARRPSLTVSFAREEA